jgi:hypothetical protein
MMRLLALDVGGANLKAADGLGYADSVAFPLWRQKDDLAAAIGRMLARFGSVDAIAATMTGELADCFVDKAEGVRFIVDAIERAADGRSVRVYRIDGALVDAKSARDEPALAAASNWHALATFAGRFIAQEAGLLLDVGSTTCDVIPITGGKPSGVGKSDVERLIAGEMVYTGVARSPVCAVVAAVPWRGQSCPVAQELFATTRDVYLMLGDLPERADDADTADGRPATRAAAIDRLGRCICVDRASFNADDAREMAQAVASRQAAMLGVAAAKTVGRMTSKPATVVVSGSGEFLARRVAERLPHSARIVSLTDELGPAVSQVAPAHALATLAREEWK